MPPKKKIDPHNRKMPVIQLYNIRTKVSIFLCKATCGEKQRKAAGGGWGEERQEMRQKR